MLKLIIVIVFLLLVVSLLTSFGYLMKDQGDHARFRTWHVLGIRVFLTVLLIAIICYGVYSGQLYSQAPWSAYH